MTAKRYRDEQQERENDLISPPISFSFKMINPEHSVLKLTNLCEPAVSSKKLGNMI